MPKPTFGPRIQYVLTLMLLFFTLSSLNSVKDYDDITVSLESKILPTCSGSLDGTLKINVSGGTPPTNIHGHQQITPEVQVRISQELVLEHIRSPLLIVQPLLNLLPLLK